MPLPKAYLESSVISYLAARESRDPIVAAHQQLTRDWWNRRRGEFDLYVSVEVLNEIRRGDPEAAKVRLSHVGLLPVLETDQQARELAARILAASALPAKAAADAMHIAIATVNGMEFLLTWNCTHIANAAIRSDIEDVCRAQGYEPPVICTPEELLET